MPDVWATEAVTGTRDRLGGISIKHVDGTETYVQPGDEAADLAETLDACGDDQDNVAALLCDRLEGIEPPEFGA